MEKNIRTPDIFIFLGGKIMVPIINTNIYCIYTYRKEQHGPWVSVLTYIFIFTEKNNKDLGISTNLYIYIYKDEQHGPGYQY